MTVEFICQRRPTIKDTTFGDVTLDGVHEVYTLEDAIREIQGRPVSEWKVPGRTAIGAGTYEMVLEDSPRFGPGTITLLGVVGFDHIRIHGGNDDEDTEGCPVVGFEIVEDPQGDGGNLRAGTSQPALRRLKGMVRGYMAIGERCFWTIRNPPPRIGGIMHIPV